MPLRINTKPRHRNSRKADADRRCPSHLQWLRGRPCCVEGPTCSGKIEAAHVDRAGGKGMGIKVSDFAAVPLCRAHHAEYHAGALTFEQRHAIDLVEAAGVYAFRSPHRVARDLRRQREARA